MGMTTGIRIVQGIVSGTINGAALQALLATPSNRASWQTVINSRSQARLVAESATAMSAVNGSTLAAADFVASSVAISAAGASFVAQTVIGSTGVIFTALAANEPKYATYIGSLVSFDVPGAAIYTLNALLSHTTARSAIFANPAAIAVIGGSAAGRQALVSVHAAFTALFDSAASLRAFAPTAAGALNAQISKASLANGVALVDSGPMAMWTETLAGAKAAVYAGTNSASISVGQAKGRDYVYVSSSANNFMYLPSGFSATTSGYTIWLAFNSVGGNQRLIASYQTNDGVGIDANGLLYTTQANSATSRAANYLGSGWRLLRLRRRNNEFYVKIDGNAESADLGSPPAFSGGLYINAGMMSGSFGASPQPLTVGTIMMLANQGGGAAGAADPEIERIHDLLFKQYIAA